MMTPRTELEPWPRLDYPASKDAIDSLHMQCQVVGKVKAALTRRAAEWVKENVDTTVDPPAITEGSTILQF